MHSNITKSILTKIIGLIFLLIAYCLFMYFPTSNLFYIAVRIILIYFMLYHSIMLLFYDLIQKNKLADYIFSNVLYFPINIVYMYQHYSAPIIAVIMFGSLYFIPSFIVINLATKYEFININGLSILYTLNLLSVFTFAYYSNKIMQLTIMSFDVRFLKTLLIKLTNQKTTRYYTYVFMTTIYVSYNILNFSSLNLPSLELLNSIKEVFVTFVAIDTLIQLRKQKRDSSI